jgi:hypothetical protein
MRMGVLSASGTRSGIVFVEECRVLEDCILGGIAVSTIEICIFDVRLR